MKKVIIIGAGIGGITTSVHLARKGFEVIILEKNPGPGGRCSCMIKDGHRFDTGATLLMMTDVYRDAYASLGKNLEEELDLIRMDPIYSIQYSDGKELLVSTDLNIMKDRLEALEPGCFNNFLSYMDESYRSYQLSMKNIIDRNYYGPTEFFNPKNLALLFRMKAFQNHYKRASRFFQDEALRIAFTFQNIYVGQNPMKASAIFSMLPFLELTDGVWYPRGGMNAVTTSMLAMAEENQVNIRYNTAVKEIKIAGNKAHGVVLEDESFIAADVVISNADLPFVYKELLPESRIARKIDQLKYTCSAFVYHWGLDAVIPGLEQHNVFVSGRYKENIEAVFDKGTIPDEPSFYVHAPARSDPTAAPEGKDSISVIVPVSHTRDSEEYNVEEVKMKLRNYVFKRLEQEGVPDIEKHINFEACHTPHDWKDAYHISHGAIFGSLNHNIFQMGYMRPHNQHDKYKNLFFVGGSTHPGNGVPMCLISARLTAEKVIGQFS